MCNLTHDIHFRVHFLIQDTVFHEASLLKLFGSKRNPVKFGCNFVDNSKGTFANAADLIVL